MITARAIRSDKKYTFSNDSDMDALAHLAQVRRGVGFPVSVAPGFSPARFVFNEMPTCTVVRDGVGLEQMAGKGLNAFGFRIATNDRAGGRFAPNRNSAAREMEK